MKKIFALILITISILSIFTLSAFAIGSSFGYGASVVANEVTMVKTGILGKKLCFNDADFKSALCIADFKSITLTKVPKSSEGTLLLGGRRVCEGRVIKQKNLGSLVFIPASEKISEASFSFTVEEYVGGAEIRCVMKFIDKVNYAPKLEKEPTSLVTQESISVFGTLKASDPEGDRLEFITVSYPKYGRVEFVDKRCGRFVYTPSSAYTGTDYFTYVVRDEYGNYSEPAKIELKVNERMCQTVYTDMEGREEYNSAVAMTAMGVMGGKILGDQVYFMPDESITRAEFVAMAMKSYGIKQDSTLSGTCFDDDKLIPMALRGYVATAERLGYIGGDFKDGELLFSPNEPITRYEAAKIMAAIINAEGESEESVYYEDNETPVWARASVSVMTMLGIFDEDDRAEATGPVCRADAAEYLYKLSRL